jgi:peptidoglycan-N-acetylglucosamine deacetylase
LNVLEEKTNNLKKCASLNAAHFFYNFFVMWYWIKTHQIVKRIFSNYVWDIPTKDTIYLTFDDGPTPQITTWVLEQLEKFSAKATFFCIGENIQKHPELFEQLFTDGHAVGNHTFNHLNGLQTANKSYLENVGLCQSQISNLESQTCNLFRPPYGKITPSQGKKLRKMGFKIIMWDVLSADFDTTISKEKCLKNVIDNIRPGSIVVFHDSQKAFANLEYVLPKVLEFAKQNNWKMDKI